MVSVVTINRPDVVELIEAAADRFTAGNKTEAVALGLKTLLEGVARNGSLFGAHRGSVRILAGVDLTKPILEDEPDAESGKEVDR